MAWLFQWAKAFVPDLRLFVRHQTFDEQGDKDDGDDANSVLMQDGGEREGRDSLRVTTPHKETTVRCPFSGCELRFDTDVDLFVHAFSDHSGDPTIEQSVECPVCKSHVDHFIVHLKASHSSCISPLIPEALLPSVEAVDLGIKINVEAPPNEELEREEKEKRIAKLEGELHSSIEGLKDVLRKSGDPSSEALLTTLPSDSESLGHSFGRSSSSKIKEGEGQEGEEGEVKEDKLDPKIIAEITPEARSLLVNTIFFFESLRSSVDVEIASLPPYIGS